MTEQKTLHFQLSPETEKMLTFVCFVTSGLVGYVLTHFVGLLH
jgi:hypothetical protein